MIMIIQPCGPTDALNSRPVISHQHLAQSAFTSESYFDLISDRCAKCCDERVCMSVCMSLRSHISKPHVQTSRNFLHVITVTVARSFSDNNAIRYVLPGCVDDVTFSRNRPGKVDANRAYTYDTIRYDGLY